MRGRYHRRHHQRGTALLNWCRRNTAELRAYPRRAASLGAAGLVLVWLTLTKTLPFALAPVHPDWALAFNPGNPDALIGRARQIMEPMLIQNRMRQVDGEGYPAQQVNNFEKLAKAANGGASNDLWGEHAAMRNEIKRLALRALATDPLNAEAYELLAVTAEEPNRARALMQEAARHSRREAGALIWLLNDSFHQHDYAVALDYGDLLLRTHPQLSGQLLSFLARAADRSEISDQIAGMLAMKPAWREQFFEVFPRVMRQPEAPLKLMAALRDRGTPPSRKELAPYLDALTRLGRTDTAYNAWLRLAPEGKLGDPGLLADANFENAPGVLPFDWRIAPGLNAVAEFVVPASNEGGRLFHVSFGSGRVKFPELSQIVLLSTGRYRFEGRLRGRVISKRGLRWQLVCVNGSHRVLAQTDMLMGETLQWRIFSFEGDVQTSQDCNGQVLRLMHDSRSPSEEFISGEVWFGGLRLERIASSQP